jgi:hypothetical protein
MKELMQYRLTKTIPWFLTRDRRISGRDDRRPRCSMQLWRYRQKMEKKTVKGFHPGARRDESRSKSEGHRGPPGISSSFPIENVRFDPAAHWYDVVGTSPYVISRFRCT